MSKLTTIAQAVPKQTYTATGQTTFAFDYPVEDASHLVVTVDGVTQTSGTDYTVTVASDNTGATVTFTNAVTGTVEITRSTAIQLPEYHDPAVDAINKATLQHQLARLTLIAQDLSIGSASSSSGSGGNVWEEPPLKYDGTDETQTLEQWLEQRLITDGANTLLVRSPAGKRARIDGPVSIRRTGNDTPFLLDMRLFEIDAGKWFRLRIKGGEAEFPTTNTYLLAADALASATTIRVNLSPQNGDHSRLDTGATLVIRGQNDKYGQVLDGQKHVTEITGKTVIDTNTVELTLADALPQDFLVSYPASEWTESGGGADQTHITVMDEIDLASDHTATDTFTLAVDPTSYGWQAGDWVVVQSDRTAGDVQGTSTARIARRMCRISSIDGANKKVTLDRTVPDEFLTADKSRITRLEVVQNATIRWPNVRYVEDPDPAPASRVPTFEAICGTNLVFDGSMIDDEAQGRASRGQLLRMELCAGALVRGFRRIGMLTDHTNYASGDGYGIYLVSCRDVIAAGNRMERARHGIVLSNCWSCAITQNEFRDCLVNGFDTHGAMSRDIFVASNTFVAGASRAPDASNQSAITIGNTSHQAGDFDVHIVGNSFHGFQDVDGAIEIRTPSADVSVMACVVHDCVDAVTLKETGTIDGGAVYVDGLVMRNSTGYAVDDDTTATKFSRISIGTVLTDGNEAGVHSQGASGAALRPDLVPDKGTITGTLRSVTAATYGITVADLDLVRSSADYDLQRVAISVDTADPTAVDLDLPNNAPVLAAAIIFVPDTKTAAVTVSLASGASFRGGATSYTVAPPRGDGIERRVVATCTENSGGSNAVWVIDGDIEPPSGVYLSDFPIEAPEVQTTFAATTSFSALSYAGAVLVFNGTAVATLTLDTISENGDWKLLNDGTADLTVQISGGGSVTVAAGECAALIRNASAWYVVPGGAFTK